LHIDLTDKQWQVIENLLDDKGASVNILSVPLLMALFTWQRPEAMAYAS
jgi:hypothetical protein